MHLSKMFKPQNFALFSSKVSSMVCPPDAPGPIGPFVVGKIVTTENGGSKWGFSSGALGMCPQTGELVSDEPAVQADRALKNMQAVIEANGFTMADAIKTTVFVIDMADFTDCNEVYAKYFVGERPARSCVAVHQLPKGAKFEIEAIFFKG